MNEGITGATVLHAELRDQGWTGSVQAVRHYVRPFRQQAAAPPPTPQCAKPARSPADCYPAPESSPR